MGYCCISLLITSFSHHLFNAVIYIRNIIQTTTIKRESPVSLSVRCQVFGLFLLPFYQEHHHKVGANCSQKKKGWAHHGMSFFKKWASLQQDEMLLLKSWQTQSNCSPTHAIYIQVLRCQQFGFHYIHKTIYWTILYNNCCCLLLLFLYNST